MNWWNSLDQTVKSLIVSGLSWFFSLRKRPQTDNIKLMSDAAATQSQAAAAQSQAAADTVSSILAALKHEAEERKRLEKRVEALEIALDMKNNYIEALEREIEVMKTYMRRLIKYLRENDVHFPEPPKGLLDTEPKMRKPRA